MTSFAQRIAALGTAPTYWWKLGDAVGSTKAAESENANTATVNGSVTFGEPSFRNETATCAQFENAFLSTATELSFSGSEFGQFSMAAWINTTSTTDVGIFGAGNSQTGTPTNWDRTLWVGTDGLLHFGNYSGGEYLVNGTQVVNDGNWHFLVAVCGPNDMTIYVDAVVDGTGGTGEDSQNFSGYWRVAGSFPWSENESNPDNFTGLMAHACVWNDLCLTQAQVTALADIPHSIQPQTIGGADYESQISSNPDLSHWWPLVGDVAPAGETSNWVFPDNVGGAPLYANEVDAFQLFPGIAGSEASGGSEVLNSGGYALSNAGSVQPNANDFALEIWVYRTEALQEPMPVMSDTGQVQVLAIMPSGIGFAQYDNYWSEVIADVDITLGQWHHLMVSVDPAGNVSLYWDGEPVGSGIGQHVTFYGNAWYVGFGYYYTFGYQSFYSDNGPAALAHAAIYEHAQPAAVAMANYLAGSTAGRATAFGATAMSYGDMHLKPYSVRPTQLGRVRAGGGAPVGRAVPPMLVRRGALSR